MAIATATPKIVGKALYLELIADPTLSTEEQRSLLGWQSNGIKQVIIFPQYQDDTGEFFCPVVLSRTVSANSPKSQWETTRVSGKLKPASVETMLADPDYADLTYIRPKTYDNAEWAVLTEREKYESRKFTLDMTLRTQLVDTMWVGEGSERESVGRQGWKVRENKPIVIELTDQDMSEVLSGKTPQAVIRRINKVRGTLDKFPEKLA
jgi:hypothetical protein